VGVLEEVGLDTDFLGLEGPRGTVLSLETVTESSRGAGMPVRLVVVTAPGSGSSGRPEWLPMLGRLRRRPGGRPRTGCPPRCGSRRLRLARQLEGLRAKLALGPRKDAIPQPSSEVQEEGERSFGLEETLGRHRQILQALQGLSQQLAQAERQWKKQLGSPGHTRPMGAWDSAKFSALLHGQRTLLQDLQEMRDAAAHVASRAQLFYLPVGTKHHFLELAQILSLLQKDLQGPLEAATKKPRPPGQPPGASSCLRPSIFLFFLLIQTIGFFCYMHFRWVFPWVRHPTPTWHLLILGLDLRDGALRPRGTVPGLPADKEQHAG